MSLYYLKYPIKWILTISVLLELKAQVKESLAGRVGALLNYSNIASELEVTVDTIKRYCLLLEKTFILKNLTTYSRNVRNEILKTPKVYITNPGIRNSLLKTGLDLAIKTKSLQKKLSIRLRKFHRTGLSALIKGSRTLTSSRQMLFR